jgi:hypothetical protein
LSDGAEYGVSAIFRRCAPSPTYRSPGSSPGVGGHKYGKPTVKARLIDRRVGVDRKKLSRFSQFRDRGCRLAIEPKDSSVENDNLTLLVYDAPGKGDATAVADRDVINAFEPGPNEEFIAWVKLATTVPSWTSIVPV